MQQTYARMTRFMTRTRLPLGMLGSLVAYGVLTCQLAATPARGMFTDRSDRIPFSTRQLNYGVAVSDVDGDGELEWIVAGYSGPNLILKLDKATGNYYNLATADDDRFSALRDEGGQAIGVCACDIDGDGREEIYFLNTNDRYSGPKLYKDKLFKWRRGQDGRGKYEDLFSDSGNDAALSMFAGRSVAAVDRKGTGKYSIILATYAQYGQGSFGLIEMDESASDVARGRIVLRNVAREAGIAMSTGGRGITVGPIVGTDGRSDIFFDNEGGSRRNDPRNALFVNDGNGRFTNVAESVGLADTAPGRGVALADFNNDGRVDIVYGNWMDPHRLMIQQANGQFQDVATSDMSEPSPVRTVIAADFDNDGILEVFYNNIVYQSRWGSSDSETWKNRLFRVTPGASGDVTITKLDVGAALEPNGYGTGGAVSDMDGDGQLELLLSHGESSAQDLSLYHVTQGANHHWLRVMPLTRFGAPARGAKVTVMLTDGTQLTRIVDGGSGYLCQMEPVAHFGLGFKEPMRLKIQWPDDTEVDSSLTSNDKNKLHRIPAPRQSGGSATAEGPRYRVSGQGQTAAGAGTGAGNNLQPVIRNPGPRTRASAGGRRTFNRRTSAGGRVTTNTRGSPYRRNTGTNRGLATGRRGRYTSSRSRSTNTTNSGASGTCRTTRVQNFIRDEATGCYSSRPIRMGQCQGSCSTGGMCCQPRADRYRGVQFRCRDGRRYRQVAKAGVVRCRCARCPEA